MESAIEINQLTKIYNTDVKSVHALDNVDLKIRKSNIYGLLGPNGAGKSTLINIIAGLTNKTSGSIKVLGIDKDSNPNLIKNLLGVVPQEIVLDTFFTLYEYLEFISGYYGIRKKDRKTDEILSIMGLTHKANATSRDLSGGMKRRFLMAKALIHSPQILILDEPTAGVDINSRDTLWSYVKELNKAGITIILTTHYFQEAENLCDEIGFINHGKIIKVDSTKNLIKKIDSRLLEITVNQISDHEIIKLQEYGCKILDTDDQGQSKKIHIRIKESYDIKKSFAFLLTFNFIILNIEFIEDNLESIFRRIMQ